MVQAEVGLPEIEERMRQIAREIVDAQMEVLRKEVMEGELGRWRGEVSAHFEQVWRAINQLAEAQRRTEEWVSELAEAQRRTEERLERLEATVQVLAEAQRRTEERLNELAEAQRRTEERLNELAEAQKRTEETVLRLSQQLAETNKQVGQLANRLGLDLEVDAEEILREVLKEKGLELLQEPFPVVMDGETDVAAPVRSPEGETFWVLVEVKGRVRRSEVGEWLRRLKRPDFQERLREAQVDKPYLPYIFGLRIYQGVKELAQEAGLGVLDHRGERVSPRPWR